MVRAVLFSVALSAILIYAVLRVQSVYQQSLPERVTRIDIYADRIGYRNNIYSTPSLLAIGLKAANDPPKVLALHVCARQDDLEMVVEVLREQGYLSFEVELPDTCPK